jgi:hypothetical protein
MPKELIELLTYLKIASRVTNNAFLNKIIDNKQYDRLQVVYVDRELKDYTKERFYKLGFYPEYNPAAI